MTSLITAAGGGALNFDSATWPVALRWLSKTGWRVKPVPAGPGQTPRIDVTISDVDSVAPAQGLTAREVQVLMGMAEGKGNDEIGLVLHLSGDTIKSHARTLYRKLGAKDRAHAVAIAYQRGILGGPQ
jgi:DNA-binding CsgD family transcriptional regulator